MINRILVPLGRRIVTCGVLSDTGTEAVELANQNRLAHSERNIMGRFPWSRSFRAVGTKMNSR